MRFVKLFLISVVVLFAVLAFLFSLFPSQIKVSRVITINAQKEKVEKEIGRLNDWGNWNQLAQNVPLLVSSNPQGPGTRLQSDYFHILLDPVNKDTIKMDCAGSGHRAFAGGFYVANAGSAESATVEWYLFFHVKWYPWEKLASMFYDKQLGPSMEVSLASLKTYVEKIP